MTSETEVWEHQYRTVRMPHLNPAVTGFNACIDRIIPVTARLLASLKNSPVRSAEPLLARLVRSMRTSIVDEWFVTEPEMYQSLAALLRAEGSPALGGQAGITALHLHSIGVPSVTCVLPRDGPETCALLQQAGVIPMLFGQDKYIQTEAVHFVFEYSPGLVDAAKGVIPRNNRFIASPLHDPSTVLVPADAMEIFLAAITPCRRAFLSGYQYLQTEQDFIMAAGQLRRIRSVHPGMQTHVECVTVADRSVLSMILQHILPNADSIGLNEHELQLQLQVLRDVAPAAPAAARFLGQVRGMLALAEATGVHHIHLHT